MRSRTEAGGRGVPQRGDGAEAVGLEGRVRVTSEIGRLRRVICHTPGPELLAVTPATREDFLYDDIIDLELARREHRQFKAILSRFCEVFEVRDLLESVVALPEARSFLVERVMDVARSEGLARRLHGLPPAELVRLFVEGRPAERGALSRLLNATSYELPPLPNLFFTRDASMVLGTGVVIGAMRYEVRWTEEILMKALFRYHPLLGNAGILYDGSEERRAGFSLEGGDLHVLREDLALLGMSERSSPAAFDVLAEALVRKQGIRDILVVVLPVDRAMIHLDMIFTMIDREHCVVFPPSFTGPTRCPVLHYRAGGSGMREKASLFEALRELDLPLEPVYCGGGDRIFQEREQWSSGCNFVAVRPGVVLGYSRNERTYRELEREAGYRVVPAPDLLAGGVEIGEGERVVVTFEGSELVRGGGGARCMTMPFLRDDV
jgi:arginine deiminase